MQQASFQVDSRLGTLPSQNYSTTGEALKELVDNAWDADAEEVGRTSKKAASDQRQGRGGKFAG
ncbi:hypothetical protein PSH92_03945 [Pseudomonas beijingensis]|uniref:Uncharacterized protein n=1 Tax=Pseudomonas beijingensis TaxID=2954101 RepID=A0ABY9FF98_9PSED|nr:hypothetical protein [Pseudomonas sp. FP2034]WLH02032.1 hypothetical protein PSH92_03945 [Pseudomonas sp. FP2034]